MEITVYRRKTLLQRLLKRFAAWVLCACSDDSQIICVPGKGIFVRR